jgi:hypothetical protein
MLLYVDDALCINHAAEAELGRLDKYFKMKPDPIGDPDSVFRMGMLCLAFKKSAAISASAAEDITFLMILAMTEMDPLNNF